MFLALTLCSDAIDQLNALSVEVGREIREHMSKLQQEPRLRCLVITGTEEKPMERLELCWQ